jgi:hypothetical protein
MATSGFEAGVKNALVLCRQNVAEFIERKGASFAEDLSAFDGLFAPLCVSAGRVSLYVRAHPDAEMRELCMGFEQELGQL